MTPQTAPRTEKLTSKFLAQITGTTTTPWGATGYTFVEWWLTTAGWVPKAGGGRTGTVANPGVPVAGSFNVGDYALARQADGAGGLYWELTPLAVAGCLPTSICPIWTSGVFQGIRVQYTCSDGTVYCLNNPTNCCPSPPVPPPPPIYCTACQSQGIPQTLYLTLSGFTDISIGGGNVVKLSCLNGQVIPLNWSVALAQWVNDQYSPELSVPFINECLAPVLTSGFGLQAVVACAGSGIVLSIMGSNGLPAQGLFWLCSGSSPSVVLAPSSCSPFCASATVTTAVCVSAGLGQFSPIGDVCSSGPCTAAGGTYATGTGSVVITASPSGTCGSPAPSWTCNASTGGCIEVYDGSGFYSSLSACQSDCAIGVTSYECVSDGCVEIGGSGGTYATLANCQSACGSGGIAWSPLGAVNDGGNQTTTLQIYSLSVSAKTLLILSVAYLPGAVPSSIAWTSTGGGADVNFTQATQIGATVGVGLWSAVISGSDTGYITITGLNLFAASVIGVTGLANWALDNDVSGYGTPPTQPSLSLTTGAAAKEIVVSAVAAGYLSSTLNGTWSSPFTDDTQDQLFNAGGGYLIGLSTGLDIVSSTGTYTAAKIGVAGEYGQVAASFS